MVQRKHSKEKLQESWKNDQKNGTDYNEYRMGPAETVLYVGLAGVTLYAVGWIFYRSVPLSLIASLFGLCYPRIRRKQIIKNRKKKLMLQFKDMLYSLSSALGAGSSMENAIAAAYQDIMQQYNDPNAFILRELELMMTRLRMNRTVEEVFRDLAERSHVEDIETFASIFEISKRTGGNLVEIMRSTTDLITEKMEIQLEIETVLAGQKMQQKVLAAMPILLVFLMTQMGGGFMDPIFETTGGRLVSTAVLAIIFAGILWSGKIADIKV